MTPPEKASRAARITDVAAAAGVSVATISRALRSPDVVAPETLERVLTAIRDMGYTPNAQARNLRTSRAKMIIAIVPDIANPFFSEVIRGIERVAQQQGYSVLLGDTENNSKREEIYAQMVASRQVDGAIILLPHISSSIRRAGAPIVNACEYVSDKTITSVYSDNVGGARSATEYLLALGHVSIGFIGGPPGSPLSVDRERGYVEAMRSNGLSPDRKLMAAGDFSAESGVRATEALLARGVPLTALMCANDEMALGALRAVRDRGLSVPADISIIGFDDIRLARFIDPPLTTVAQPMQEIGREAMTLLIELLADPTVAARKRILPTQLIIRGSTAKAGKIGR